MSDPMRDVEVPTIIDLSKTPKIDDVERQAILYALKQTGGVVVRAAALLGLGPATVYRKIRAYSKNGTFADKRMIITEAVRDLTIKSEPTVEQPILGIYQEPSDAKVMS